MARPTNAGAPPAALMGAHTGYLLHRAGFLLMGAVELELTPLNLTGRKFFVLTALHSMAPLSQKDLSDLFALDPAVVVTMIDEFEATGLVRRQRNSSDKRRYTLVLTQAGSKLLTRATEIASRVEETFLGDLGPRQRSSLHRFLTILLRDDQQP